ncbi:STAS domain-containing protein [Roseicitreum antarcticum]|uniref:STAS domain-containing protein n=1 Tax=Roseicitreum antarcticum TaxID=564137 RepID=A0A1H3ATA0_9RHOB|nr:STAS domain-containing protein [Roseicitreum antarcticum]SDX32628.1 STAS domain-containing protein [Roseicitreum antarcticum]
MTETVKLQQRIDHVGAQEFYENLKNFRGLPVSIDGTEVVSGGTLLAQILLAMAREWNAGSSLFELKASAALHAEFECLGLDSDFRTEGLI